MRGAPTLVPKVKTRELVTLWYNLWGFVSYLKKPLFISNLDPLFFKTVGGEGFAVLIFEGREAVERTY